MSLYPVFYFAVLFLNWAEFMIVIVRFFSRLFFI